MPLRRENPGLRPSTRREPARPQSRSSTTPPAPLTRADDAPPFGRGYVDERHQDSFRAWWFLSCPSRAFLGWRCDTCGPLSAARWLTHSTGTARDVRLPRLRPGPSCPASRMGNLGSLVRQALRTSHQLTCRDEGAGLCVMPTPAQVCLTQPARVWRSASSVDCETRCGR